MNISVRTKDVAICSSLHVLLGLGGATIGVLTTAVTIGSFALGALWVPALIFAAPMAFTGVLISLAYACIPSKCLQRPWVNFAVHTGLLATCATVTLAIAITLGFVTPVLGLIFGAFYTFVLFFFTFSSIIKYLYPVKEGYIGSVNDVVSQAIESMGRINDVD